MKDKNNNSKSVISSLTRNEVSIDFFIFTLLKNVEHKDKVSIRNSFVFMC